MKSSDEKPKSGLEITGSSPPSVPVYTCRVYVSRNEDGTVTARVANLAGIETTGASERDVLAKVCREFKSKISESMSAGNELELIEPPSLARENEQVRSIPVHL